MRTIEPGLAARLAGGTTTLARCWRLTRRDGVVIGCTDHDRDLAFEGTAFLARTGLDAAEAASELGLAVAAGEVAGALTSESLTEAGLEAGRFDGAVVETFLVDWSDVSHRRLLATATLGEVKRQDNAFTAELRSAAHRLNQVAGRIFAKTCDADLGDEHCGVDLAAAGLASAAAVTATDGRLRIEAAGLGAIEAGRFTAGRLTWTGGANAGLAVEIKRHAPGGILDLWRPAPEPIASGDGFVVSAGCDKRFRTCRDRFANAANFRGFPHMPGNDRALGYARTGAGNNGQDVADDDA